MIETFQAENEYMAMGVDNATEQLNKCISCLVINFTQSVKSKLLDFILSNFKIDRKDITLQLQIFWHFDEAQRFETLSLRNRFSTPEHDLVDNLHLRVD